MSNQKELYYAGRQLQDDLAMCRAFDELQKNDEVIILDHGRDTIIHEMEYVTPYDSNDRRDTGRTHLGFEFHYIVIYYAGKVWDVNLSQFEQIELVPHEIIDGWDYIQCAYPLHLVNESVVSTIDKYGNSLFNPRLSGVYPHSSCFGIRHDEYNKIYNKYAGEREKEIYNAPHICYLLKDTGTNKVVRCAKTNREPDGVRRYFDIDLITGTITG